MEKPKVLIFSDCYIYGGSERLMTFLLKNEGIRSEFDLVFAFREHADYVKGLTGDLQKLGVNITTYPLLLLSNDTLFHKINCTQLPSLVKKIIKIPFAIWQKLGIYFVFNLIRFTFFIKKVNPRIVHINNGGYPGASTCNQFVIGAHICGIRPITYQVNNIAFKAVNPFSVLYDRYINKYVKAFITASARAGTALVKERLFEAGKVVQIANTILPEKIKRSRTDILQTLQWPDSSFLLIQVAFLTARKGQLNLIKAVQQIVNDKMPGLSGSIKLILVGNGEDEWMLKKYVKEAKMENIIFFAGYSPDSLDYINACDVFVLPSVANEDMPLSLLSAMSCGRPILASRFAGIAEAIADGRNGLLIDPASVSMVEEIKKAIVALYLNPDKRKEMGEEAMKTFKEQYSEEIYAKRINNLYWEILSEPHK